MKTYTIGLLSAVLLLFLSFKAGDKQINLYIIGDSTAANKLPATYPETGWGMALQAFFKKNVKVDNRALNGRSTKSFRVDKNGKTGEVTDHWQPIMDKLVAGDYVFIEFGHNDEKIDKPDVGTSTGDFKINLVNYVNETRAKQAIPVLLTPIMRRSFVNGVLTDTHGSYPDVIRKVADSLKVPLIDMHRETEKLITELGEAGSVKLFNHVPAGHVNYPKGKEDNTHLSPEGASRVAGLVVEGIKELALPLVSELQKSKHVKSL